MTLKANWFQTSVSPLVDARDERRLLRALRPTGGVVLPTDFAVSAVGAGTTLNVSVAACAQGGGAVVPGLDTHQGAYFAYNDAALQVPIAVADPTNPRIDTVILRIYDDEVTPGAGFAVAVEVVRGTPAAGPVAPALPRDCIPLANVAVAANATGIAAGNITDRRVAIHGGSQPRGIICNGGSIAAPNTGAKLPLDTVVNGPASWLANSRVLLPPGAGGLYLIECVVNFQSPTVAAIQFGIQNAAAADFAPPLRFAGMIAVGNPRQHWHGTWLRQCADGESFAVWNVGNPMTSGSAQCDRFSMVRLGDALLATPGAMQQPAPPDEGPEVTPLPA